MTTVTSGSTIHKCVNYDIDVVLWLVNVAVSEVMYIHKRRPPFVIGSNFEIMFANFELHKNITLL